jgi:ankyrin repeat protein
LQDGQTPLHVAANDGYDKVVEVLVQAHANMNAADKVRHVSHFRFSALHCDCEYCVDNGTHALLPCLCDYSSVIRPFTGLP